MSFKSRIWNPWQPKSLINFFFVVAKYRDRASELPTSRFHYFSVHSWSIFFSLYAHLIPQSADRVITITQRNIDNSSRYLDCVIGLFYGNLVLPVGKATGVAMAIKQTGPHAGHGKMTTAEWEKEKQKGHGSEFEACYTHSDSRPNSNSLVDRYVHDETECRDKVCVCTWQRVRIVRRANAEQNGEESHLAKYPPPLAPIHPSKGRSSPLSWLSFRLSLCLRCIYDLWSLWTRHSAEYDFCPFFVFLLTNFRTLLHGFSTRFPFLLRRVPFWCDFILLWPVNLRQENYGNRDNYSVLGISTRIGKPASSLDSTRDIVNSVYFDGNMWLMIGAVFCDVKKLCSI